MVENNETSKTIIRINKSFLDKFRKVLKEEKLGIRPIPWYAMKQTNKKG